MTNEFHDDLFASVPPPRAPAEIRLEEPPVSAGSPHGTGLGACLRAAREARGMDLATCGQLSHLSTRVLQQLESGDYGDGNDYVFVRGALNSYARLLGVPAHEVESALQAIAPAAQPQLVPTGNALRAPWVRRYGAAATYIILTAMVAVPLVWLGLRGGLDNQLTRIAPLDSAPATGAPAQVAKSGRARDNAVARQEPPLQASMTPFSAMQMDADATAGAPPAAASTAPAPTVAAGGHVLTLRVNADSWVEVNDADGKTVASGILRTGDQRDYHSAGPLNVTIGNADGVQVQSDGKPLSLAPYRRANVARFQVFGNNAGNG
ncbi:MAG: DUF4115 domain-containing protein [Proteobacteria bacterium]|nr:DUF4115 domain-containing protein [Pseudomonadota bacterium]